MPIKIKREENDLLRTAKMMFQPAGKEPYWKSGKAIRNFQELVDNLNYFNEGEAAWVASWIDYLGDRETAQRIKSSARDFKNVIQNRYGQLRKFR